MISDVGSTRASLRVLLVEDNPRDAELLREHVADLRSPAMDIIHVPALADAMDRLSPDPGDVDAILLDLGLPDCVGLDGLAQLRAACPDVPLVVLTGNRNAELGVRAVQSGAQDFLSKNALDGGTLVRSLQFAIERSRLESQVRVILSRNLDAMIVIGERRRILYVNRAAEDLFERSASDLVGSTFEYEIEARSSLDIEVTTARSGELRLGHMRIAHIEWAGAPALLASIRDITDLRRAQELERRLLHQNRLSAIGQLAAGVAHEVNNPAAFVLLNLDQLRRKLSALEGTSPHLVPEALTLVDECAEGMDRISSIVRDLSTFSRIERDEFELVSLHEVAETAANIAANEIRHRARLFKELEEVSPIVGDRAKLTQVVLNLLINAVHATPPGDERDNSITITTRGSGDSVIVSVSDTGSGIPDHVRRRLFEPFFTTKPRDSGTGLGLAICAEVVAKHEGQIEVHSEVGRGSRFDVVLPRVSRLRPGRSQPPDSAQGAAVVPMRLLVVDDETLLRRALRRLLEPPHTVVEADGAEAAIALLERDARFDAVLCDVMMPGLDGPALHAHLEREHSELADRTIFLTGGAMRSDTAEFLENTGCPVLTKPVRKGELRATLAKLSTRTE